MTGGRREIIVVGSGFAGSILARILALRGRDVVLVERGRHPRFALGESSTPLASLSLERLAGRYGLEDLRHLSTHGRWKEHLPHLRRGLKRGFTFYRQAAGRPYANDAANRRRLLVAASPDDEIADVHWMRSDVDAFLVDKAVEAGVDYRPQTRLTGLRETCDGVRVTGAGPAGGVAFEASFLVDGTGGQGFVARALPLPAEPLQGAPTRLIFGHLEGAADFADRARAQGATLEPGPYDDSRAAVHHLLEEGWLYLLPFDHGVVSAGLLSRGTGAPLPRQPAEAWAAILQRYPTLEACLGSARPLRPMGQALPIGYRRSRAVGARWLLLPHAFAFFDPLFSTGMAWSLLAVERVAEILGAGAPAEGLGSRLGRYGDLLGKEASQICDLVEGAYLAMGDFESFCGAASLYFAAVSFQELCQRLLDAPADGWAWQGFLGATDPVSRSFVAEGRRRLGDANETPEAFGRWVRAAIGPRNVIGLCDPARRNLYPVDLGSLRDRCELFGLSRRQLEGRLPRLRS